MEMGKKAKVSSLHLHRAACFCVAYVIASAWFMITWMPYSKTTKLPETKSEKSNNVHTTVNALSLVYLNDATLKLIKDSIVDKTTETSSCVMNRYLEYNMDICKLLLKRSNTSIHAELDNMGNNSTRKKIQGYRPLSEDNTIKTKKNTFTKLERTDLERTVDRSCNLERISDNCTAMRDSYLYGKDNITTEEELFPLAFAFKIHSNANQAHRLLRFVYRKHNTYCIHVDKKAEKSVFEHFKNIAKCFDNIAVIEDRVTVVYSTIRHIEAEFRCIDAVRKSKQKWRYYINLTGQEFMLKTNLEIVKILKKLNGSNDIESYAMGDESYKFKRKTLIVGSRSITTNKQKLPFHRNITIRKGCAYGMLSRQFIEFVKHDSLALEFIHWLNETYAPEEMVWATLNALPNTPGGYTGDITLKDKTFISRAVIWAMDKWSKCAGKFVRFVCIYGLGDISRLLENRNIIANKFYEEFEPIALDCLEKEMYTRILSPNGVSDTFNLTVYNDLPQAISQT